MPEDTKRELWVMPEWMEKYRKDIGNTGGNPIEELMNDNHTTAFENATRAIIIVAVKSQVSLLETLHKEGRVQ